ncbi:MAG: hemophore-related protein [Segniliparus sp.]|uniref:hemophore-related protein n=1 Tax=Segniliparus sp. TaxID=2804064 RepID=UPI003F3C0229
MTATSRISTYGMFAAAIAAGAAFLFPGSASAAPQEQDGSALVNTTCSVEQIDAAAQKEAPKFWEKISSDPEKLQKANDRLQAFLDKSPEERQAALGEFKERAAEWSKDNPDKAKWAKQHKGEIQDAVNRVFTTCDQY